MTINITRILMQLSSGAKVNHNPSSRHQSYVDPLSANFLNFGLAEAVKHH